MKWTCVAALLVCCALDACVSERDRFYRLTAAPAAPAAEPAAAESATAGAGASAIAATAPTLHVVLSVDIPSLVDRAEMVLDTSDYRMVILDHERWAGSLSEQVAQTLARDIESERPDVLVGDRAFDRSNTAPVALRVDIVRMAARQGGQALIEAHWRLVDEAGGADVIDAGVFSAPTPGSDYAMVAQAYSEALRVLADKLAAMLPHR